MATRRAFLKHTGGALAGAGLLGAVPGVVSAIGRRTAPSDTLSVGLVGARGMGFFDLENHLKQPGVVCGGLCDVDEEVLSARAADVERITGRKPRLYRDFREMLEEPDLDAVVIATPDHWHCLQTVYACQAGKDVYVEKPLANSIDECDAMVRAARRYGRVVQVGQQQRSGPHWQAAVDVVRAGTLGDLRHVRAWGFFDYGKGQPRVPDEPPPPTVDFDLWLGPAPRQPFNRSRFHGSWRHQWDFGGGLMTDWGVHLLDVVLWALDVQGPPRSVSAVGGLYSFADRAIETPDTLSVLYELDGLTLSWEHAAGIGRGLYGRPYGVAFVGNDGTLVANREGWEVLPEVREGRYATEALPFQEGRESNHEAHAVDFLEAVRTRREPACPVEAGRLAAFYAHLGNLAYRTRSRLVWDPASGRFEGNDEANRLLRPAYRKPWEFPDV